MKDGMNWEMEVPENEDGLKASLGKTHDSLDMLELKVKCYEHELDVTI